MAKTRIGEKIANAKIESKNRYNQYQEYLNSPKGKQETYASEHPIKARKENNRQAEARAYQEIKDRKFYGKEGKSLREWHPVTKTISESNYPSKSEKADEAESVITKARNAGQDLKSAIQEFKSKTSERSEKELN
jgi:hypothetical protein